MEDGFSGDMNLEDFQSLRYNKVLENREMSELFNVGRAENSASSSEAGGEGVEAEMAGTAPAEAGEYAEQVNYDDIEIEDDTEGEAEDGEEPYNLKQAFDMLLGRAKEWQE
jgi:hypothetical protein